MIIDHLKAGGCIRSTEQNIMRTRSVDMEYISDRDHKVQFVGDGISVDVVRVRYHVVQVEQLLSSAFSPGVVGRVRGLDKKFLKFELLTKDGDCGLSAMLYDTSFLKMLVNGEVVLEGMVIQELQKFDTGTPSRGLPVEGSCSCFKLVD